MDPQGENQVCQKAKITIYIEKRISAATNREVLVRKEFVKDMIGVFNLCGVVW